MLFSGAAIVICATKNYVTVKGGLSNGELESSIFGVLGNAYVFLIITTSVVFAELTNIDDSIEKADSDDSDEILIEQLPSKAGNEQTASTRARVRVNSAHLSDAQHSTSRVTTIRPGETIYGVYRISLLNRSARLNRVYEIPAFKQRREFSAFRSPGNYRYSWGFKVPDRFAQHNKSYTFRFIINADGNRLVRNRQFKVLRYAIVDSSRAYQSGMNDSLRNNIILSNNAVASSLRNSFLNYNARRFRSSPTANIFLNRLNNLRPNAVLIHAHGNSSDGGRIYFHDPNNNNSKSFLNADSLRKSRFKAPAGLFYAAICSGSKSNLLGDAFIKSGYDAFISYRGTVKTDRNRQFYQRFFRTASLRNVSVADALNRTRNWAILKGWSDVAAVRIIGDGRKVYLGGVTIGRLSSDPSGLDVVEYDYEEIEVTPWREISMSLSDLEAEGITINMVKSAENLESIIAFKDKYGGELIAGFEVFPSFYRIAYKVDDIYIYGVDIDKDTGEIIDEGPLG